MKTRLKNIAIGICIIVLIDVVTGYLLFKSRLFSHLAVWNVLESDKQEDFYWPPENAPAYFHFEPDINKLSDFKKEILSLVNKETDEFKVILTAAKYVMDLRSNNTHGNSPLKWGSPEEMLKQVQQGAAANCFHRAILFSTYLSGMGIKSRLWTLENDNFNATAHSINEVYIKALKKWVFIDVMFGFYVTDNGIPLSVLEFRERLLNGDSLKDCRVAPIESSGLLAMTQITPLYRRLIKCVFLRANNDFVDMYNRRYGIFSFAQQYIDRFPANIKRGLDYLLGRQKFIHYVDRFSKSLQLKIVLAKLFFYFFIFSPAAIGVVTVQLLKVFVSLREAAATKQS